MDDPERAVRSFLDGHNCSQAVLATYAAARSMDRDGGFYTPIGRDASRARSDGR